jgi:heat shock protein HslJ
MKFITLLLTSVLLCCGNAKEAANNQSHAEMKSLSGTYKIDFIANNTELPEELSITFDETTNTVSGFSGCNNFTGKYSVNENSIKIGALATTRRFCKRFMDVEQNMLKALSEATTFTLENGVLNIHNSKMLLLKTNKITNEQIDQDDNYTIEYVATTRGFYTQVIIKNGIMSIQKDRDHKAPIETIVYSEEELKTLNSLLKKINLENLSGYEGPTEKRFYDGAAIAKLIITWSGNDYATPSFDHGYPNSNIEVFVNTLTSMAKMPK